MAKVPVPRQLYSIKALPTFFMLPNTNLGPA
jgi:hypothetical protein